MCNRQHSITRFVWLVILVVGLVVLNMAPVLAAKYRSITVDVGIDVEAIIGSWTAQDREQVLSQSREEIAKLLKDNFQHWDFKYDQSPSNFKLAFNVIDPVPGDASLEAYLQLIIQLLNKHGQVVKEQKWTKEWLSTIDIQYQRYPTAATMAQELVSELQRKFLDDRGTKVSQWVYENIPVSLHARWLEQADKHQIVLAMPENMYGGLRGSIFNIKGKPHTGLSETLEARGLEYYAPYPPDANAADYNGIATEVVKRVAAGQEKPLGPDLRNITKLGPIYLKKELPVVDVDIFFDEEDLQ